MLSIREIFFTKLKNAGYDTTEAEKQPTMELAFKLLEPDREKIFYIMYGDKIIEGRGTNNIKESVYRLIEAEKDVQLGYIPSTMFYLLTQIKVSSLRL